MRYSAATFEALCLSWADAQTLRSRGTFGVEDFARLQQTEHFCLDLHAKYKNQEFEFGQLHPIKGRVLNGTMGAGLAGLEIPFMRWRLLLAARITSGVLPLSDLK
jgi:hypothetical protein